MVAERGERKREELLNYTNIRLISLLVRTSKFYSKGMHIFLRKGFIYLSFTTTFQGRIQDEAKP